MLLSSQCDGHPRAFEEHHDNHEKLTIWQASHFGALTPCFFSTHQKAFSRANVSKVRLQGVHELIRTVIDSVCFAATQALIKSNGSQQIAS